MRRRVCTRVTRSAEQWVTLVVMNVGTGLWMYTLKKSAPKGVIASNIISHQLSQQMPSPVCCLCNAPTAIWCVILCEVGVYEHHKRHYRHV